MRREEEKFVTPQSKRVAKQLGEAIRAARLARNVTQESIAARARMSKPTWLKIEKGDVSVAMASWMSALEQVGLLARLDTLSSIEADPIGQQLRKQQTKVRARRTATTGRFDF